MASPKLLIGGVVTVGSVSTAAVVAHQQGFFSSFNKEQETNTPPNNSGSESTIPQPAAEVPEASTIDGGANTEQQSKPKQEAVKQWLTDNDKGSEGWTIKIKKSGETDGKDFKDPAITEEVLGDLETYLNSNKDLLKSLFSALEPKTLTFEKIDGNWKLVLTKEDIKKWVDKASGNKATLKIVDENVAKELTGTEDLNKLLKDLFKGKSAFTGITIEKPSTTKDILFEKVGDDWKHIKEAIEEWLKSSGGGSGKLRVQIKKGSSKTFYWNDSIFKDEDLVGLLKHLKDKASDYVPKDQTSVTKKLQKKSSGNNEWEPIAGS